MKTYTPRRAGKHWLEGAPEFILDVFKYPRGYDVYFGGSLLEPVLLALRKVYCLEVNDMPTHPSFGVSMWGEAHAAIRPSHHRIRWLDLPENVRQHIVARATS